MAALAYGMAGVDGSTNRMNEFGAALTDAVGVPLEQGPVPLYYQLEHRLRARINADEFQPGSVLPTEDQICCEYDVSRITVRRALDALQQQGLIERRRGVGSFVTEKPRGINSKLTGSLNEFLSMAGSMTTRCLSIGEAEPTTIVRKQLQLEDSESAVLLRTVGILSEGPVAYLEIWFPTDIGSRLDIESLSGNLPVVRLVELAANIRITRAEQTIEPDRAGSEAAVHLAIGAEEPILHVRRTYYAGDRPIEHVNVRYHPERYRYAIEFKG